MAEVARRNFLGASLAAAGGVVVGVGGTLGVQALNPPASAFPKVKVPSEAAYLPIDASNIDKAVDRVESLITDLMKKTGMPGVAAAVVHNDKIVFAKGFGVRKVGTHDAVDTDTVFQLASLSKSLSGTVMAAAVEKGIVAWDDPVIKHLKSFKLSDEYATNNVTLADMFSHRSGLPDHAGDLVEDLGYDESAILSRLQYYPLAPIRAHYAYTNFGLTAAAAATAAAAGMSWDALCHEFLFDPLKMSSTNTTLAAYKSSPKRAYGHVLVGKKWEAKYVRDPDPEAPAGGVSGSVKDMAAWLRLQLAEGKFDGTQVIDAKQILTIQSPHMISGAPGTPASRAGMYGYGIGTSPDASGRVVLSHSGQFAIGAGTNYMMMPAEKLGIVVLGNGMAIGLVEAVTRSFFDIVETGDVRADWYRLFHDYQFAPGYENPSELAGKTKPASPSAAPPASAVVGKYTNDLYGPAAVIADGDALVLTMGAKQVRYPLTHWDGATYSYEPIGENAAGISAATFTVGAGPTTLALEPLNTGHAEGLGVFTRV
ncbi:serine hydrolase [Rathayibacter soli]|uniref:serine hydrolase n=1 Tax=Rathayibacter soli TaxID=3144168 RepID=UPI0027E51DC9|nr:serine hydrolase [Glaciibacter superstes]